jgi:uncharacterized protein YgbK (DUF1537 family)
VRDARAWLEPALVRVVRTSAGAAEATVEQVALDLAQGVVQIVSRCPVEALVATGGDTAVAILRALDQPVVRVMGDLLPGIPYGRIAAAGRPLWLVTKAGGFGTRDTLVEIVERLRASS